MQTRCTQRDEGHEPLQLLSATDNNAIQNGWTEVGFGALFICKHCGLAYFAPTDPPANVPEKES